MIGNENFPVEPDSKLIAALKRLSLIPTFFLAVVCFMLIIPIFLITWIPLGIGLTDWYFRHTIEKLFDYLADIE